MLENITENLVKEYPVFNGKQTLFSFENGYGIFVAQDYDSRSATLRVVTFLRDDGETWVPSLDNTVFTDVLHFSTNEEFRCIFERVKALPWRRVCNKCFSIIASEAEAFFNEESRKFYHKNCL